MEEIQFYKVIPKEYKDKGLKFTSDDNCLFDYKIEHGEEIGIGSVICVFSTENIEFEITSNRSGVFCMPLNYPNEEEDNCCIGTIYDNLYELCQHEYQFTCHITFDTIKKSYRTNWQPYDIMRGCTRGGSIELNLTENRPLLSFIYPAKELNLKIGDKLYFCNSNSPYLELEIITPPHSDSCVQDRGVDFFLLEKDLESLIENDFDELIIEYKDGRPRTTIKNTWGQRYKWTDWYEIEYESFDSRKVLESSDKIFHKYVKAYKKALFEVDIKFEKATNKKREKLQYDSCFVYLMHDSKNGYHKIGISKTPKYREKTLQSEKPTIDMICAKEFPSRKIAEAIEQALHKVYAEERIRGEWFDLSETDVAMICETLK